MLGQSPLFPKANPVGPPGSLQTQTSGHLGVETVPLSNSLRFTVEATHLPTSCPPLRLGWGRQQMHCLGTLRSGGNKVEVQVWVRVRDQPVGGPCCRTGQIRAPTCSSNHLARLLGNAERSPVGTGRASETHWLTIDCAHGSLCGWKVVLLDAGPSRGRLQAHAVSPCPGASDRR